VVDEIRGQGQAGNNAVLWDAKGGTRASGIYIYRLEAGSFSDAKRMVLMGFTEILEAVRNEDRNRWMTTCASSSTESA
jgi:hypothetical protein